MCALHTHLSKISASMSSVQSPHIMKNTNINKLKNIIGPQVKAARLAFEPMLSQDAVAGRLAKQGIALDRSAISRIESQERYVMDYEIVGIAKCLKVSVGYLLGTK